MDNEFSYEALIEQANLKAKPKRVANIITYSVAGVGIVMLWVGMILSWALPETFLISGIILAVVGMVLVALSYPLHRFIFSKLIKKRLDALIKILENQ